MPISRRWMLAATSALAATLAAGRAAAGEAAAGEAAAGEAAAAGKITVAFAGSMGVVMDQGIGPAFEAKTGIKYQGIGQAALGLAHLLAAKSLNADVFVSVSPAPIKVVEAAKLVDKAVPVASTEIVLAYSPKSKFASAIADAGNAWPQVLSANGFRFGRTDPKTDPQGQYVLYTLQLASLYYKIPGLQARIAGAKSNIFAETSLLAQLAEGEVDASLGYESAVISQNLPYIKLPAEINFSNPALAKSWYSKASLMVTKDGVTKTVHPGPLVFYASALADAANSEAAAAFVAFLQTADGQALFKKYGYNPGQGPAI